MKTIIKIVAALALVLGLFTACTLPADSGATKVKDKSGTSQSQTDSSSSADPAVDESTPPPPPAPPAKHKLVKSDITLKTKIRSKQCFGSAGCIVEIDVTLGYAILDPGKLAGDYDVTYRITGDESGPIIETLTLYANGRYDKPYPEDVSTRSSSTPIGISVVSVSRA